METETVHQVFLSFVDVDSIAHNLSFCGRHGRRCSLCYSQNTMTPYNRSILSYNPILMFPTKTIDKVCRHCKVVGDRMVTCGQCGEVAYCGDLHRHNDMLRHSVSCRAAKANPLSIFLEIIPQVGSSSNSIRSQLSTGVKLHLFAKKKGWH